VSWDYYIRPAREHDLGEIMELLEERVRWLRERNSDQWADVTEWRPVLRFLIRRRHTWVLVRNDDQDEIVGTVTVLRDPDVDFWLDRERARPALYLSKLATARHRAGHGLGERMLEWAIDKAAREKCKIVRLDVWRASPGLHEYYKKLGWRHVKTVELGHRRSGTLFAHPAVKSRSDLESTNRPVASPAGRSYLGRGRHRSASTWPRLLPEWHLTGRARDAH
jgi:GNAT superfamily N-acetyltransferase